MEEISAYHEAGHAIMALAMGAKIDSITISPEWDDGPPRFADIQLHWPSGLFTETQLREKTVAVALAGHVAEMLYTGDPFHPAVVAEWTMDWQTAWQAAEALIANDLQRMQFLEQMTLKVYRLFKQDQCWSTLATLVDQLLAHETLEGDEVEEIVGQWVRLLAN